MNRRYRTSSPRKLFIYQQSCTPELKQEQHQRIPNNTLKHNNLHHQTTRFATIHSFKQRNPHYQRIW
ncbi:hypothetical protein HanXRQr2_Chr06g0274681 [Helianthus annuus]|uniref:Uncharacterized protein n=1 Tax=Helianthus annuus TaxID=4232 RepID=A0A9K3IVA0_HELAN|nr:hypothetical protein HanXRQr2_Chr06g0274681 [Helianthus annuus]KAJ0916753.1 hypothetical protein HanPSC8_Chr06g0265471 [Helianthus annuus]